MRRDSLLARALLVTAMAVPTPDGQAQDAGWPMYMKDPRRGGVTSERLALPLTALWVHQPSSAPRPAWPDPARGSHWQRLTEIEPRVVYDRAFHPVAVDNHVYYASSSDDHVHALDANTGARLWSFATAGPVRFAPAVAGDAIYFGSDDGRVYALDRRTGERRWSRPIATDARRIPGNDRLISAWPVRTGVVVDDGVVYATAGLFPEYGTWAVALDAADGGRVVWRQRLVGLSPQGYLLASSTRLYVPNGRANPSALEREGGRVVGAFSGPGGAWALLTGDELVTGPGDKGELDLADDDTRDKIARIRGLRLIATPELSYVQTRTHINALDRSRFVALTKERAGVDRDAKALTKQLRDLVTREKGAPPSTARQQLEQRVQHAVAELERLAGELSACVPWRVACPHAESLILAGNVLFAGGEDAIAAYAADDGRELWTAPVDGRALGLAVACGRLLVGTDRGTIHAFGAAALRPAVAVIPGGPDPIDPDGTASLEAATIASKLDTDQGYGFVLGCRSTHLVRALAAKTRLQLVALVPDERLADAMRSELLAAGLHGHRITVRVWRGGVPAPELAPKIANLLVLEDAVGGGALPEWAAQYAELLRPYGGTLVVHSAASDARATLEPWLRATGLEDVSVSRDDRGTWGLARRGALEGAGHWTHVYGDAANTTCSDDAVVSGDLALQWFGGPGPNPMVDRHLRTSPPLFSSGYVFIPAQDQVIGIDAYNGTVLWGLDAPGFTRTGAPFDAGYFAARGTEVLLAVEDRLWVVDGKRGVVVRRSRLPAAAGAARHWGWVATVDGLVYGSAQNVQAAHKTHSRTAIDLQYREHRPQVTSDAVFCVDPRDGTPVWTRREGVVLNPSLAIAGDVVVFLESGEPKAVAAQDAGIGRVKLSEFFGPSSTLVAVDKRTGTVVWERPFTGSFLHHACFICCGDGKVIVAGSGNQPRGDRQQNVYRIATFDLETGEPAWNAEHANAFDGAGGSHGEQVQHPVVRGTTLITEPIVYDLRSGERIDPTGGDAEWFLSSRRGCGTISASRELLFFRDQNPTILDLTAAGARRKLTSVSRPGCWINILPAGGLVLLPEASSGCVCSFPLQTSMAFAPR